VGLRIFETDPEAAPKPRRSFAEDMVGRFRSGYQINGRPSSLEKWRVTTGDPEVAETLRELLGGEAAQEWETKGEDNLEVFTDAASIDVLVDANAIRSEMVLWGRSGAIRKCDGVSQGGDNAGKPCECPSAFSERKAAADRGTGCQPNLTVYFRLAADPDLGKFRFTSGSWTFAKEIGFAEDDLAKIDGTAKGTLSLEVVEYESQGKKRRFVKPVLKIIGEAK
jgi:hypothetical protein